MFRRFFLLLAVGEPVVGEDESRDIRQDDWERTKMRFKMWRRGLVRNVFTCMDVEDHFCSSQTRRDGQARYHAAFRPVRSGPQYGDA